MKLQGIQSVTRRKRKKYVGSTPQQVAENVLNRKFEAEMPNKKWLTDVTEFKCGNGKKAYLRFKEMLDEAKLTQSMSRVGRCIDNGPMESFWGTLKCKKYYLHTYWTFKELQKDIDDHIHFYNYERLQRN